jgi:ATP synthase protein I
VVKTGSRKFRGSTTSKNRKLIQRLLLVQVGLTLLITALLWLLKDWVTAYSALLGGMIYLIPSLYQARKVFAPVESSNIRQILRDLYKSEIWKMALTIVLFGVVFSSVRPIEPFSIFSVFILMQVMAWFTPLFFRRRH